MVNRRGARERSGVHLILCMVLGALGLAALPLSAFGQEIQPFLSSVDPGSTITGVACSGNTVYICGNFLLLGSPSGGGVPVDARSGAATAMFARVAGTVYVAISDRRGGWYVGGEFTGVGGLSRAHLAHIFPGGLVDAWSPNPNGIVTALSLD